MNCRDIESLILAERDGALTPTERAALSDHVATCPACQDFRTQFATSLEAYRAGVASVPVPDVDAAWRDVQAEIRRPAKKKGPLAPVVWFGAPLAAAAAIAFAFVVSHEPQAPSLTPHASNQVAAAKTALPPPPPPPPVSAPKSVTPAHLSLPYDPSIIAGADYVETGPNTSTMVYVDKESGWLVVWATDLSDSPTSG